MTSTKTTVGLKAMLLKEFPRDSVGWLPFHRGADGEIVVRRLELFGLFQVRTGAGFCQECGGAASAAPLRHEREGHCG